MLAKLKNSAVLLKMWFQDPDVNSRSGSGVIRQAQNQGTHFILATRYAPYRMYLNFPHRLLTWPLSTYHSYLIRGKHLIFVRCMSALGD